MAELPAAAPVPAVTAAASQGDAPFVSRYFRHVDQAQVGSLAPGELLAMVARHRDLGEVRRPGEANVRVTDGAVWVVTDDMPFLVASVVGALERAGVTIGDVVHPQLVVRRDDAGVLEEILDEDVTGLGEVAGPGVGAESWMRVEVPSAGDPAALEQVVVAVLADVRAAVADWGAMTAHVRELADEVSDLGDGSGEDADFLRWLVDDHFTFLGVHAGPVEGDRQVAEIRLGVLTSAAADDLPVVPDPSGPVRPVHVNVGLGDRRATVHRTTYPDLITVRHQGGDGHERQTTLLGHFTSRAYTTSVLDIPVVREKVNHILEGAGWAVDSHSGAHVLRVLETFPRDELFQAGTAHLREVLMAILRLEHHRRAALFLRTAPSRGYVTAMVYLPRDRYRTSVRLAIEQLLRTGIGADEARFTVRASEESMARLYYVLRREDGAPVRVLDAVEQESLAAAVVDAARSWTERLARTAAEVVGDERAEELMAPFGGGFPPDYREDFAARQAVSDLKNLVRLDDDERTAVALYDQRRHGGDPDDRVRRLKLFSLDPVSLTEIMPLFRAMGFEVVDEEPYELTRRDGERLGVYDFGLRVPDAATWERHSHEELRELVESAVAAIWAGRAESDGYNALVVRAGMTWRQVVVLRTLGRYIRQASSSWSRDSLEQAVTENHEIARDLLELFETRFDPDRYDGQASAARAKAEQEVSDRIDVALEEVSSLEHDRIIRAFRSVIRASLRTSFYQVGPDGEARADVSLKLAPGDVPGMPKPHPAFEIWVHGPGVEGVHLRFGQVARGGLRWSDRRDDFRTEVLGLVKAQMVKNAVIVPTGSKGGFFAKDLPDPSTERDAWLEGGKAAYRSFISGLLTITDNRVEGEVVPPERVVRHDGDDPYLVVAADKGTATFSDLANEIAAEHGFWLDDAFASGGSVGYDHKGMGITARGAWESVKRHFREMGVDTQTEDFTVVGIGDMSGDVFGNGMLLSEHIRLVAAFDHRHVFVDPSPDAARSYAERRRLFDLPRSSWDDYDRELISEGGGIWPRTAKSVPVSAQAAEVLGLDGEQSMTPTELIHAILQAPVDLLWNGGIGTYVKARSETDTEVGDRANEAIRVDGGQLRVKVVGEGGNLGCTQRGRIEAAHQGVRINTDAVDNSAGVDTSDHEVNIKILLGEALTTGTLAPEDRTELLLSMTDEVGHQVLRDNYEQNVLLGNARAQGGVMLRVHEDLVHSLEVRGELDRELEFLPSSSQVDDRLSEGHGLTSPELSVLLAYAKMTLKDELLASDLPDDPATRSFLVRYFPEPLRERFDEEMSAHPLRREIVTTAVANDLVNRGGITFVHRAADETGATSEQIARAYVVARRIFGLEDYVAEVEALDNQVSTDTQTHLYLEFRRLLDRAVRWFLAARPGKLDVTAEIERFGPAVRELGVQVPTMLRGTEAERLAESVGALVEHGVPQDLARWCSSLLDQFALLDIIDIASDRDATLSEVAGVYYTVSEHFGIDDLLHQVTGLPRAERWDALARGALRDDLYAALQALTRSVLDVSEDEAGRSAPERFDRWAEVHDESWQRVRTSLAGIRKLSTPSVAALTVALRAIRSVIR